MEKERNIRYNKMHVLHKTFPQYQIDFTQNLDSTFRPLAQTEVSEENFIDHQYGFDPYKEDRIHKKGNLEYRQNYEKPMEQIEVDDTIDDPHVSDTPRHALIDLISHFFFNRTNSDNNQS